MMPRAIFRTVAGELRQVTQIGNPWGIPFGSQTNVNLLRNATKFVKKMFREENSTLIMNSKRDSSQAINLADDGSDSDWSNTQLA